ncbi:MAG: hypothetical protein OQJ93_09425 [Ignavibacteriaceae bacterium]|nr:hypothetical protein [Ignavibacteriaceae bacterium]
MAWKFERIYNEQSGQLQKTGGGRFDLSKYLSVKNDFDTDVGAVEGRVFNAYYRNITFAGGDFFYFRQLVDPSEIVNGLSYTQILSGGPVEFTILVGCTPGAVLETIPGYNIDRRRFATGDLWESLSPIQRLDGLTGGTIVEDWFSEAPSQGNSRSTTPSEESLTIKGIYNSDVLPYFICENTGNGQISLELSWVWKELIIN